MKVNAYKVEARYLRLGDLYSDRGPDYWAMAKTNAPCFICMVETDDDSIVYRLEVRKLVGDTPLLDPTKPPGT